MAQDLNTKKRAAAINVVDAANALIKAIEKANSVGLEIGQSGLTYVQADFEDDDRIKHLTPSILTAALTSIAALDSWLTTNFHYTNIKQAMLRNYNGS